MSPYKVINNRDDEKKRARLKMELDEHLAYLNTLKKKASELQTHMQTQIDEQKSQALLTKLNNYGNA